MGSVWLHDLPDVLRGAGLPVIEYPGWETRSRSSGGYEQVRAIGMHHNAAPRHWTWQNAAAYSWQNSSTRPIGAVIVDRDGTWIVGAAGATNTQGKGGPVTTSRGTIPKDRGNLYMFSIEPMNDGQGEPWSNDLQTSLVVGCAALVPYLGLSYKSDWDILAHFEWTNPGKSIHTSGFRKIDPAGPSLYAVPDAAYPNMWDMDAFRGDVETEGIPPEPEDPMNNPQLFRLVRHAPTGAVILIGPTGAVHCDGPMRDQYLAAGVPDHRTDNGFNQAVIDSAARSAGVV